MKNRTRIFSALLACVLCLNLAAPACAEELSPADSSPPAETESTETKDTGQAEETAEPVEGTDSVETAVTESETPAETEAADSEEAVPPPSLMRTESMIIFLSLIPTSSATSARRLSPLITGTSAPDS